MARTQPFGTEPSKAGLSLLNGLCHFNTVLQVTMPTAVLQALEKTPRRPLIHIIFSMRVTNDDKG
jgi:hypothetical protein